MWLIPSRARPSNIMRLVSACRQTDMVTPAVILLDSDDTTVGSYMAIELPENWTISISERVPLGEIYNRAFAAMPVLEWYGIFADDVVPETMGWDTALINAAGADGLAYGDDSVDENSATHFVIGGDLARSVGWLGLPGLDRLYIDTAWNDIAEQRSVKRYLPKIKITHHHFSNRLALMDATYKKTSQDSDRAVYETWRRGVMNDPVLLNELTQATS